MDPSQSIIRIILSVLAALLVPVVCQAQSWRSELYPEDWQRPTASDSFYNDKLIQDFSYAGYQRGEQAVPNVAGPIFNVVTGFSADPTGATDSTVAIQNAIDAAATAGGGVVHLPAGEFRVSPQGSNSYALRISSSNIVLRGAGVADTFLLNTSHEMRGKAVVQVSPPSVATHGFSNITADLPGPTRRIPVDDVGKFPPGGFVRIEWELTDAWIAEHNQQTWWNATNGRPANARYLREVLATNPGEGWIEVDVPTRYTLKPRDNARVIPLSGLLHDVGVESLSIGNLQSPGTTWGALDYLDDTKPAYENHGSWLIRVSNARDSWITDVHSKQAAENTSTCHMLSNGISVLGSFRVTLRDCEMRRSQYGGGGGNGYMFRVQHSNECLLERCIADFSRHGIVLSHAGTSGNVFLQCEDRESSRSTGHTGFYDAQASGSDNHMHFSHSNLFDRCHAHNSYYTASHRGTAGTIPHGLTSAHAIYWNTTGSGTRYNNIVLSSQGRYGYIIGTSGTKFGATNPTTGNTAPADHLEGIGTGATLEPASLYLDQLSRRLEPRLLLTGQPVQFPNNTFGVEASLSLDGEALETYGTLEWETLATPSGARIISTATTTGMAFTVSRTGSYTIGVSGFLEDVEISATTTIEVLPPVSSGQTIDLTPVADSHVQGGPHPSNGTDARTSNFGDSTTILVKDSGAPHVHREAFMRFDLGGVTEPIQDAKLHLYFTSSDTAATGRTSILADNTWGEMTINHLNRPTVQTALVGDYAVPAQAWLILDAGHVIPSQVAGNGLVTFRHQITSQPSQPVYSMASRENPDPSIRPFLRVHLAPPTLDEWLAQNSDLEPHERGPLDDPDTDGLPNLLEAWLGTDASNPDSQALPELAMADGEIELHMKFNAAPPGGLVCFIETSATLAADDWQLATNVIWEPTGEVIDGRIPMVARVSKDALADRKFYRVSVEME